MKSFVRGRAMPSLQVAGLALGALVFLLTLAAAPFTPAPEAQKVAAVTLLMAIWWITEATPLAVTALVPLVLFPLLGVTSMAGAAAPYADPIIFLFLGGFVLGCAMERCNLHRRLGLACVAAVGTTPSRLIAGILCATAGISMWVSNSATAALMLPVAASVLAFVESKGQEMDAQSRRNLGSGLMLAVAYGANIGGLGTLIGSPPNALMAGYMAREHGIDVSFAQWMMVGLPVALVMMVIGWGILCWRRPINLSLEGAVEMLRAERARAGAMSTAERRVAVIFVITALAWVLRPILSGFLPGLNDTVIAIAAALALFLIPSGQDNGRLAEREDLRGLPWDVLILFGGGLSMAAAFGSSGLAEYLGSLLSAANALPSVLLILLVTIAIKFLTELTSNTATAATFLPIGGALAMVVGGDPLIMSLTVAMSAGVAFMMPVGTPPNAIVYSSGRVTLHEMMSTGIWTNIAAIIVVTIAAITLAPHVFGG